MDTDNTDTFIEESHNQANEAINKGLRYMARYGFQNLQICQCKGDRIVEIYKRRGFVEVDETEYKRILQIKRDALAILEERARK